MHLALRRGQTLLEMVIAIAVITISTLATTTLIVVTITTGRVSQARIQGANLAREGAEIVRDIRDSNWLKADKNVVDGGDTTIAWDDTGSTSDGYVPFASICTSATPCGARLTPSAATGIPSTTWTLCVIGSALCPNNSIWLVSTSGAASSQGKCPSGSTCYYSQGRCPVGASCQKTNFTRQIVITAPADSVTLGGTSTSLDNILVTSTVTAPGSLTSSLVATEKLYNWK